MASGTPKEKSVEFIKMYGDMLVSGIRITDEVMYRRSIREIEREGLPSENSACALAFLHAIAGKKEKAHLLFIESYDHFKSQRIANNHIVMLHMTGMHELEWNYSCKYADELVTKKLTRHAYSHSYRFGSMDKLVKYFDKHISLLSVEEGRDMAELHKDELISELSDAYQTSGCSEEQFLALVRVVLSVAEKFDAQIGAVEASCNSNSCYTTEIKNKSPKDIAAMNFALAEAVCDEPNLDDCALIARYSPVRKLHAGVSYGYSE